MRRGEAGACGGSENGAGLVFLVLLVTLGRLLAGWVRGILALGWLAQHIRILAFVTIPI